MAVELAKLSLWLHSFTVGAPLSFLDHHLRWGNSLIGSGRAHGGARHHRPTESRPALGLFGGPFAGLLDLTAHDDRGGRAGRRHPGRRAPAAPRSLRSFQAELTPYKQVLDLWVSQYFGNEGRRASS